MIEQVNSIISGEERLILAKNAIELAANIYENIDQEIHPGIEVSRFDLYRNGSKNKFSGLADFFKAYSQGYDRAFTDTPIDREFVWVLEKNKRSEFSKLPVRGHFVESGIMLGTFGKLIEFNYGKYENYSILNEKTIKEPKHIISILGKFATENSIDYRYSAR